MPRPTWKGAITFGLVTIPVTMHNATRTEEIKFRMLRKNDLSPINFKWVAKVDDSEVPWEEIVKGYECEKSRFFVPIDEDFKKVDVATSETSGFVGGLYLMGQKDEARSRFNKLPSMRNGPGLIAEEYDPKARRLVGNFPQPSRMSA
jgi:hypothetical protein